MSKLYDNDKWRHDELNELRDRAKMLEQFLEIPRAMKLNKLSYKEATDRFWEVVDDCDKYGFK